MWRGETKDTADLSLSQEKQLLSGNAKKAEITPAELQRAIDQRSIIIDMSSKEGRNLNTGSKEQARKHLTCYILSGYLGKIKFTQQVGES